MYRSEKVFPSSNGFDFAKNYLNTIYGDRNSYENNIVRYLQSDEFNLACRLPQSLDEIPEINLENIKAQVERENRFIDIAKNVSDKYWHQIEAGRLSEEEYQDLGGVFGVCPGHCNWIDTLLYPHMGNFWVNSEEEGQAIWNKVLENNNILKVMVDQLMNGITESMILQNQGRYVFSQGYARNFFRGENAYYGQSKPSMFRNEPRDDDGKRVNRMIACLRMTEFGIWINKFRFAKEWPFGDIYHVGLAQHYGIPTSLMDVTSDIKVAIFFACCKYEDGCWRPLHPSEYESMDSRTDVAKMGGDSRYAILYQAPADISNMSMYVNDQSIKLTDVEQIGYQPFMRSGYQHGYLVHGFPEYDMYKDITFQKFKFRLEPEICEWIYAEMDCGRKIYPPNKWENIEDIQEKLMSTKEFSREAYELILERYNYREQDSKIREDLHQNGFQIVDKIELCDANRKEELEKAFEDSYQEASRLWGQKYSIRPMFCL